MTVREFANALGCHTSTITRMIKSGRIDAVKMELPFRINQRNEIYKIPSNQLERAKEGKRRGWRLGKKRKEASVKQRKSA